MSRPKHWWYHNVTRTIAAFPVLADEMEDAEAQSLIAGYSGMPRGGKASRSTENSAVNAVSKQDYDAFSAVMSAIETAKTWPDGKETLQVVDLYYWKRVKSFDYIEALLAQTNHAKSARTARRMNSRFVYQVAKNLGYC